MDNESLQAWSRLRTVVQAAAAVIAAEPKHLAAMRPMVDRALELLNQTLSADPLNELEYLLGRVEESVAEWRPKGLVKGYVMPPFAKSLDREIMEAKRLLANLSATGIITSMTTGPSGSVNHPVSRIKTGRPSMFIGSSVEGLAVAENIQLGLDHSVECTIWSQGVFGLSTGNLESLVTATRSFDFAVLVLTPDDLVHKRDKTGSIPRDNVVFELGLFMGALGRERTFIVYCREEKLDLPSDLAGITAATYAKRADGNLQAALGSVCTLLKRAIQQASARP